MTTSVADVGADRPDLHHHLEPVGDLTEDRVLAVEMRRRTQGDEELAAVGVGPLLALDSTPEPLIVGLVGWASGS